MPCDQQHAVAVVCGIVDQSKNVGVIAIQVGQHDFRRAHRPYRAVIGNRAPFACRRERNARRNGTGGESLLAQSVENRQSGAVRLSFVRQVVQRLFHGMFVNGIGSDAIQHAYFVEHDAAVGDGAGFVEVQAVHACEGLHGFELLHERVLACQTDGGEREVERGEQYEAFGDHADHASHGGHHGGTPLAGGDGYIPTADRVHLRPDEQHAQRYDEEGHEFEDGVDALVEVGHSLFVDLRLRGQGGGIAVRADRVDLDQGHAGDRGGSGIDVVAFVLAHGARFASEHGFVEFQTPGAHDLRVGGNLFAGADPHEVAEHDFVVRHFDVLAVASYEIVGGYEDGKLVERSFGFQFGDDADAGVDEDDEAEHGVSP